jgi:hypothetical protein
MMTLIKIIIVLVMSFFSMDKAEEEITETTKHQQQFQHQKADMLTRCEKTCIPS